MCIDASLRSWKRRYGTLLEIFARVQTLPDTFVRIWPCFYRANLHFLVTFSREIYLNVYRHSDLFFLVVIPGGISSRCNTWFMQTLHRVIWTGRNSVCWYYPIIMSPFRTGQIARRHMRTCNDFSEPCRMRVNKVIAIKSLGSTEIQWSIIICS